MKYKGDNLLTQTKKRRVWLKYQNNKRMIRIKLKKIASWTLETNKKPISPYYSSTRGAYKRKMYWEIVSK